MSKALELAEEYADAVAAHRLENYYGTSKSYTLSKAKERDEAHEALSAELRRLAAVEARQAELLEALQNLIEAADSMKGTYTFVQGKTPEHDNQYGHEKWAEEFLQETTDAARAAIAKAKRETK